LINTRKSYGNFLRTKIYSILILLLLCHIGFSQFSYYKIYTSHDGLPSSRIYDMMQDSEGYMWFATENGVSRYDGYTFENFTTDDGLPANSTIRLYQDFKGRIWFASFMGPLSYYQNDTIIPYSLNDKLLTLNVPQFYDNIYIDKNENMWLAPYDRGLYRITSDSTIIIEDERIRKSEIEEVNKKVLNYFIENDEIITWVKLKYTTENYSDELISKRISSIEIPHTKDQPYYQKYQCKLGNNEYLFSQGLYLTHLKNNEVLSTRSFQNEILTLFKDKDENIWISEQFNCLLMYPKGNLDSTPIEFLHNVSVSKALQDSEGNYWFSTTENGVYFVPSIAFTNYNMQALNAANNVVITMEIFENQMFFTTDKKGIHSVFIRDGKLQYNHNFKLEGFIRSNIYDILITEDKYLWVSDSEFLIYNIDGTKSTYKPTSHIGGYKLLQRLDGSVILSHRIGFHKYENFQLDYKSFNDDFTHRTYPILETPDSTLLLGTFAGLYKYKNGLYSKYDSTCVVMSSRISDIKSSGDKLWIGTFDKGLAVNSNSRCYYINKDNGLNSNRIKKIFIEDEKNVWIGTNKGLCHIFISDFTTSKYHTTSFTVWDGLPSNEINDIIKYEDLLWLGTDNGLVSFDPGSLNKIFTPLNINLECILVNENRINIRPDSNIYKSHENNITFNYKALRFKDPGKLIYYYKLDGLDDQWLESRNTSVRYPDLKHGRYTFMVKAKDVDNTISKTAEYIFTIKKHYTQTTFFLIAILFLILGVATLIFYYFFSSFKKREQLKQQVVLAEQTALRAQMNPHFIFNSLNSIQDFIVQHDDKNANLYLANFATLIRKILDTSKFNTISLSEEIETIKLYLELEKLRFEGLFEYTLDIEKAINIEEVFIPTMLLQTYIENAIWHGLIPKNDKGLLMISFKQVKDNKLSVSIKDNGIGRKKAAEIGKNRKHHRSIGMKNAGDRIKLLNKLKNTKTTIEVIDLYDKNDLAVGTQVIITFDTY